MNRWFLMAWQTAASASYYTGPSELIMEEGVEDREDNQVDSLHIYQDYIAPSFGNTKTPC